MRQDRPKILVNMSMTADGKIASFNRQVSSFGSSWDQNHLYAIRSSVDGILCGARTVDLNEVSLGSGHEKFRRQRVKNGLAPDPLRIIVSGRGTINPEAHAFGQPLGPVLILTTSRARPSQLRRLEKVAADVYVDAGRSLDLSNALRWVRKRWGAKRLVCEGGGALNSAMFRAGLVDEVHLTICPFILGGRSAPTIADGTNPESLAESTGMQIQSMRRIGNELNLVLVRKTKTRNKA